MRLIDADALPVHLERYEYGAPCYLVYKSDVDAAPTLPDGGRHGYWKRDDTWRDLYFCSACIGRDYRNNPKNMYCPDCGARMDAKEEAHDGKAD